VGKKWEMGGIATWRKVIRRRSVKSNYYLLSCKALHGKTTQNKLILNRSGKDRSW